eukprot:3366819-Rhodomonas_salina.2
MINSARQLGPRNTQTTSQPRVKVLADPTTLAFPPRTGNASQTMSSQNLRHRGTETADQAKEGAVHTGDSNHLSFDMLLAWGGGEWGW